MPLPSDEKIIQPSNDLLAEVEKILGQHPGYRPVHAKGMMLSGTFTPAREARNLSQAPEDEEHRHIIFDPIPRVDGLEPSDRPLLELPAAVYLLRGRRRRHAAKLRASASQAV